MSRKPLPRPEAGKTMLTLVHGRGGAHRTVTYLGCMGSPLRVLIHWPLAGLYELSPRTGRLTGPEKLRRWRLLRDELRAVRRACRDFLAERRIPIAETHEDIT